MNILLVEFNVFHDEILIPQIDIIRNINGNHNISVFANSKMIDRKTLSLSSDENITRNININFISKNYSKIYYIFNVIYIIKALVYILNNKIDMVIFNTLDIYNIDIKIILKLMPKGISKVGIVHNMQNFSHEKYSDFDRIFVLSKSVKDNFKDDKNIDYFYAIHYKYFFKSHIGDNIESITICIPGNVALDRRDYNFLIFFVDKYLDKLKSMNVRFIVLGNMKNGDGPFVYQKIVEKGLENIIETYSEFIPYDIFMNKIMESDIVMPLIHKTVKNYKYYFRYKITDAINMAISCRKPMLLHNDFTSVPDIHEVSFFYDENTLIDVINSIVINKESVREKSKRYDHIDAFDIDNQSAKFSNLITSIKNKREQL